MSSFELSQDTMDKLDAVRRSSNLSEDAPTEKVISVLCNEHLIRNGTTEELSKIKEEKEAAEARREALEEWISGNSRGK